MCYYRTLHSAELTWLWKRENTTFFNAMPITKQLVMLSENGPTNATGLHLHVNTTYAAVFVNLMKSYHVSVCASNNTALQVLCRLNQQLRKDH